VRFNRAGQIETGYWICVSGGSLARFWLLCAKTIVDIGRKRFLLRKTGRGSRVGIVPAISELAVPTANARVLRA
jgi:hypothetical protein